MSNVYAGAVRWVGAKIEPERVDFVLGPMGDWFRYSGLMWLVETNFSAERISTAVRSILGPNDSVLVIKVDVMDFYGWAPPQTWNWLQSKRGLAGALLGLPPY